MNTKYECEKKELIELQNEYKNILQDLIDEDILNITIDGVRVEEMTCDDFSYGVSALKAIIDLDLVRKRKQYRVMETDSNLCALKKTDTLSNEFSKNLSFLKRISALMYKHNTYVQNGNIK